MPHARCIQPGSVYSAPTVLTAKVIWPEYSSGEYFRHIQESDRCRPVHTRAERQRASLRARTGYLLTELGHYAKAAAEQALARCAPCTG